MSHSIYSWTLNQIRLGVSQVDSYIGAKVRFAGSKISEIYNGWLTAWAGKYTASLMQANPNVRLQEFLDNLPSGSAKPRTNASENVIQKWYSTMTDSPHDFNVTYRRTKGAFSEYGQWRFEASPDDTYTMIINTALGELRRQYKLDEYDDIEFIGEVFIGTPKP